MTDIDIAVDKERKRLNRIFSGIPDNQKKTVQGLIVQAARLRASIDELWEDIQANGDYDLYQNSETAPAYERERPAAKLFNQRHSAYQKAISELVKLLPPEEQGDKLPESEGLI